MLHAKTNINAPDTGKKAAPDTAKKQSLNRMSFSGKEDRYVLYFYGFRTICTHILCQSIQYNILYTLYYLYLSFLNSNSTVTMSPKNVCSILTY